MNHKLSNFAARLRETISNGSREGREVGEVKESPSRSSRDISTREFSQLALELFALQFRNNPAYRTLCTAKGVTPDIVEHWTQIPAVPTGAFKELELSCLKPEERTAVFHSSGTTEQKPSRHFHCAESLAVYEASLWTGFRENCRWPTADCRLICLTPPPAQAPHSSLVHMFETVRRKLGAPKSAFFGRIDADVAWALDFDAALAALNPPLVTRHPSLLLGTAFSFVHLLDFLAERNLRFHLPPVRA